MENVTFAEWIDAELEKRGWTQNELARRARVSSGTISNIKSGTRNIGRETCVAIADALGVSQVEVFKRAGLLEPDPEYDPRFDELNRLWAQLTPEQQRMGLAWFRSTVEANKGEHEAGG